MLIIIVLTIHYNQRKSPTHWLPQTSRRGNEANQEEWQLQPHRLASKQFLRPGTCSVYGGIVEKEKVKNCWKSESGNCHSVCSHPSNNSVREHVQSVDFLEQSTYLSEHDDDICWHHNINLIFLRAGSKVLKVSLYHHHHHPHPHLPHPHCHHPHHDIYLRWVKGPFFRAGLKVLQVSL